VPEREQQQVPGAVRAAALLVGVEGAALAALTVVQLAATVLGEPTSVALALTTALFTAGAAVVLVLLARALLRLRPAARAPVLAVQGIAAAIGWNLTGTADRPEIGLPVIAVAAAVVVGLLATPAARAALDRPDAT
jgi:hypothetical protein